MQRNWLIYVEEQSKKGATRMVDLSKFSADVRSRIENIMATKTEDGGGKNAKEIDSQKEYSELGKLLSGDGKVTGKQREIVEGMLTDYEDKYMVRDEVKQRVADIVKNGDERVADDNAEIKDLKNYKKTKGLSKEEKAFIQRVIDGKEIDVQKNQVDDKAEETKPTSTEPKKTEENTTPTKGEKADKNEGTTDKKTTEAPPKKYKPQPMPSKNKKFPEGKPFPVPVPVSGPITNVSDNSRQGGLDNINVRGNGNTVIINGENKTEKSEKTPDTPKTDKTPKTGPNVKPNKPTKQELETLANQIFDAVDGLGTKDSQLKNVLKQISKDNIIELLETYNAKHPDMFEAILDDLSGSDYTFAVKILTRALVERGGNDPVLAKHAGAIENELGTTWRSDETILDNLHGMVRHIKEKERVG